ncbi:MAG: AAA family ATPase [bacterium]|nr:AAA family ATPase [bacterium]
MKRATTLSAIHQSCDARPLRREELAEFYVPTAEARDPVVSRRDELRKRLLRDPGKDTKILLAGHGGSGKSTELVKLTQEIEDRFFTVSFSVAQECNLFHVPVEDVLVVMMERVISALDEAGMGEQIADAGETLREIHRWFAEELELEEEKVGTGIEAAAGIDTSQSYLGKVLGLLAKLKLDIRRADERVHRMSLKKPQRLGALADRCNQLIRVAKKALRPSGRHLLLIVEDLDKVNLVDARRLFLEQPAILAELNAGVLCTVPIFLLHSPDRGALDQHFETIVLPMPKVSEVDGSPCETGRKTIREIVGRRVAEGLIQPAALELLIDKTAGVLRDVFEVLVVAAEAAESLHERGKQEAAVITWDNVRYGLNRRKNEYVRAISTVNLPAEWNLSSRDLYGRLREIAKGPVNVLPSEPANMVLLQAKAILEYNGEGWFAVHPLVHELLEVMPPGS